MTDFKPLDIITLSTADEKWPPLVVIVRDFRDKPAWICINSKTAQIERVFDFIAYQYWKLGEVGKHGTHVSTNYFSRLLARAVW